MDSGQAQFRVTLLGGGAADLSWLAPIRVPAGVSVDVVDFGYRVTVIVTSGLSEVTAVADLATGDVAEAAETSVEEGMAAFARFMLALRMSVDGPEPQTGRDPESSFRPFIEATGAVWIPSYGSKESGTDWPARTDEDE